MKSAYNRLIILIIILFLTLNATSQVKQNQSKQNSTGSDLKTYKNSVEGFTLKYPAKWDTTNLDTRMIFMALEKRSSKDDKFRENMNIYKIEMPESMTLELALKNAEYAFQVKYKEGKILEKGIRENKKGFNYVLFKVSIPHDTLQMISTQAYFIKGKFIYDLSFTHLQTDSALYAGMYATILNEFYFQ